MNQEHIRNFAIFAHIDHGKSTLADRFLELTKTVEKRKMREQFLDQMPLEREKGITIKMQPVRMIYHPDRGSDADNTQKNAENTFLYEDLTYRIRGILFQVRKNLGLGHKEQVYHNALEIEFQNAGVSFQSKKNISIVYEGKNIGIYQPDFVIEGKILLELKALPEIGRPQIEQLWSYLKGCDYKLALLVNFGSKDLEIKRVVYDTARLRDSASDLRSQRDSEPYVLNLIDTPGHADFSYEVSRSLAAVEGAIVLVDATKGIQAQTLAHLREAQKQNLVLIPAVNKIDSPLARTEEVVLEVSKLLHCQEKEVFRISAKEGTNVEELLDAVVARVPPPRGKDDSRFRALIFDSHFDAFKGVIAFVRVVDGSIKGNEKIFLLGTRAEAVCKEVGYFLPQESMAKELLQGEIGYVATGVKETAKVRIGDTISGEERAEAIPGFQVPNPVVFVSLYPQDSDDFDILKDALLKLHLQDPSFTFDLESKEALGRGFRCGFLGVLHSEIITERVKREFKIEMVISRPSVEFILETQNGKVESVKTPADWPEEHFVKATKEPWAELQIITPSEFLSQTIQFMRGFEAEQKDVQDLGDNKFLLRYVLPLREIVSGLYENLKNATQGMASMDYQFLEFRDAKLVKLEFLVAGIVEEALSVIVPQEKAYAEGKTIVEKLKDLLPAQQFEVALQAAIGGKIIARETIQARRRDVTAPLYGGDVTRKRKLLERQKKGKKELKEKGKVVIPSRVFLDIFRA